MKMKKIVKRRKIRFLKNQKQTIGQTPGKLIFVGEKKQTEILIELIAYNETEFIETTIQTLQEIETYQKKFKNIWINIDGLHDIDIIKQIGEYFNIHTLILEDILHTGQRPKVDSNEHFIFTIVKMLSLDVKTHMLDAEQVSLFVKEDILLSFQEKDGDIFQSVRERIRNKNSRIRKSGLVYLKYCLLDVIVDNYIFLMEVFGTKVEELEDRILLEPNSEVLESINKNKFELNYFRKAIKPAREAFLYFNNLKTNLINPEEQLFFNDLNDLIQRASETVDSYKDMLSEQLVVYSTNVNNHLNSIMKTLTIFSAVFIPITFIAGIYGTNFENIPELKYQNGYFIMWGCIIALALGMLAYFKYKKWF